VRHHRATLNTPTPAIVSERSAQRLPRLVLLLLCIAYVVPGVFGRDPWRNADLSAFGFMASLAKGSAPWWQPAIAGIPAEGGPLPYWLGALAIKLLPWLDAAVAARLPYALVLAGVLVLVWYAAFHLARTEAAQPIAFAFGGEAQLVDYARALADGALLAMIASPPKAKAMGWAASVRARWKAAYQTSTSTPASTNAYGNRAATAASSQGSSLMASAPSQ
jgi:hypothetical protein